MKTMVMALVSCLILPVVVGAGDPFVGEILDREQALLRGESPESQATNTRRDPFVNPLERKLEVREVIPGLRGILIGETRLQGIMMFGDEPIAFLLGSDGVGYSVRAGTELRNGRVVKVDFDGGSVVFQQKVDDPAHSVRYRTVERWLEPTAR